MDQNFIKSSNVVFQISPESDSAFKGCFMLVTSVYEWGVQGFIAIPRKRGLTPGAAFYRAAWEEIEFIGPAAWILAEEENKNAPQ